MAEPPGRPHTTVLSTAFGVRDVPELGPVDTTSTVKSDAIEISWYTSPAIIVGTTVAPRSGSVAERWFLRFRSSTRNAQSIGEARKSEFQRPWSVPTPEADGA
eukprot:2923319-Rhodomonas_salina.1